MKKYLIGLLLVGLIFFAYKGESQTNIVLDRLIDLVDVNTSTPTAGRLLIADGTDWESKSISGDCTLAASGVMTCTGITLGGSDTQVQFNDSSTLGGDSGFVFNKTSDDLTVAGSLIAATVNTGTGTGSIKATSGINYDANNDGTTDMTMLSTGFGIGTTTPDDELDIESDLTSAPFVNIINHFDSSTRGKLAFRKSRGTQAAPTSISNDNIGMIAFQGYDGDQYYEMATIQAAVPAAATVSDNVVPLDLVFATGSTTSTTNRLRIMAGGGLTLGTQTAMSTGSTLDVTGSTAPMMALFRTDTTVTTGESFGQINFVTNDSDLTTQNIGAYIKGFALNTLTNDAATGALSIYTTGTTVASAPVERMTFDNIGIRPSAVATENIASGATITADACGGIKSIISTGAVTTGTTNTFTAPATANTNCCMRVINVDTADAITLDFNSNFVSTGGADVVLGIGDSATVCSTGASGKWYQVGGSNN